MRKKKKNTTHYVTKATKPPLNNREAVLEESMSERIEAPVLPKAGVEGALKEINALPGLSSKKKIEISAILHRHF